MLKKKFVVLVITFCFFESLLGSLSLFSTPVMADKGGPDEFGYIWTDSNAPSPTVTYDWVDASTGTELVWIGGSIPGDNVYNYTKLPFPFSFYGVEYTSIYINLNGAIDFGDTNTVHDEFSNKNIPDFAAPNNYIAAFWDDLQIFDTTNQKVTVMEGGIAPDRYFVIEWYHVSFFAADTTELTFEIILFEKDSVIKFQYQQIESGSDSGNNGAEATVGIENQNGSIGLLYLYNEPKIQNGMAIEVRLPDYEYDLNVDDLSAPEYAATGSQFCVNATVTNKGDFLESNIEVNFTVNGSLEDQIYLDLSPDESRNVSFNYTAPVDGEYLVQIGATPISGETFTFNNDQWGVVNAFTPTRYLLVDQGHGSDFSDLDTFFEELLLHRYWVNYTDQPLTSAALYGHDALLCLRPAAPYNSIFEVPAIQSFLEDDGGDLFVLAGSNQTILNDLTSSWSNISWEGLAPISANRVTNHIAFHPIGEDVEELYYTDQSFSLDRGTGAYEIVTDYVGSTLLGAADRVSWGKIFAVNGPGDFDNPRIDNYDTKKYLENIFEWLLRPVEVNDVGLWDFRVLDVSPPATSFFVNATVSNYGSSGQASVDVYLLVDGGLEDLYTITPLPIGASENVSFTYTHGVEETILVELIAWLPGDGYPEDNARNKTVVITSLIVVGWTYGDSSDFVNGFEDVMARMLINYDPVPSGYGSSGPPASLWNYPFILLDGDGNVNDKELILSTVFNGSIVVVNYHTFEQLLDELNSPNVFINTSNGFTSRYIFVGGGLIVEADFSNDDRLAGNWRYYTTDKKDYLALHLSELLNILLRDNDITISLMTAEPYAITGLTIFINATVYNAGTSTESTILVNFSVNSVVADSYTIPTLANDSWEVVNFTWTPPSDGTYTLEINAAAKPGEIYDTNNNQSVTTRAYTPTTYILIDSGHSTQTTQYETLLEDQRDRNFWINHSKTVDSNLLSKHEVFISLNPDSGYSPSELSALMTFLNNGGGLFVIGGSNQTALDGLTSYANLTWDGIALTVSGYSQNLLAHDTTSGIESVYYTPAPFSLKTNGIAGPVAYDFANSIIISAYSIYGQGKVFALTGESDFTDDYLLLDENLNYSRNIMDWLFAPLENNDTSITNFELASLLKLNEEVYLNATLGNIGQNTENNINVNLTINGSVEDSKTISSIAPGDFALISFTWTPLNEDNYTIRIEAQAVPGETNLENNHVEKNTSAMDFLAIMLFDQTHGTDDIALYYEWTDALAQERIGIETHDSGPITPDELSRYGAFVTIQPVTSYTNSELQAIRNFVQNGGGLLVIGDDYEQVYTELTEFAQMNWANGGSSGKTADITPHQITMGVGSYYLGAPVARVILNGTDAVSLIRDNTGQHMLVVSPVPGRVASWVDENALENGYLNREDNERAAINVVKWILGLGEGTPHDLAVSSLAGPHSMQPGDMIYVNTTVWNFGTNDEIDIYVNLSIEGQLNDTRFISFLQNGTSTQVSFLVPLYKEGTYYPTVKVTVVPGETIVDNNQATKTIWVRYIEGRVLFEQGHGCRDIGKFQGIVNEIETIGFITETNTDPVNDTILQDYAVYIIPNPQVPFSGSEITAIQNFVANKGGLWVIGDEHQEDVLASLTGFAGINWTDIPCTDGTAEELVAHEVTTNVTTVSIDGSIAEIIIDGPDALAVVNLTTGGLTMCAVSEPSGYSGRVAGFIDKDTMDDGYINQGDNLQLAENIIVWVGAIATANLAPTSLGIDVQSNEVLRNDFIYIFANGEDTEDSEDALTPYFGYRDPNEPSWNTTYFGVVKFIGIAPSGYWRVNFKPPVDALLGFYDFRVQFMDTKGALSNYSYANDSVEVKNNCPVAEDLTLENNTVIRTQSVYIYANAFDIENSEATLMPEFRYRNETESSWEDSYLSELTYMVGGFWRINFTPPAGAMLGDYDLRVRFIDQDGNYSEWFTGDNVLDVQNNPPKAIDISSSSASVYRGEMIFIYCNATDVEDDETQLIPSTQCKSQSGGWTDKYLSDLVYDTDVNAWRMNFTPALSDELGTYDIRVRFTDSDFEISDYLYSYALIDVLNLYPIADNITAPSSVARGYSTYIYANATDAEDIESSLIPHFYSKAPGGSNWEDTSFSGPYYENGHWVVTFEPPIIAVLGLYDIRVQFEDLDGNLSNWVYDSLEILNNPPTAVDLGTSASTLYRTESITIKVKGNDVEDANSDLESTFQYKHSSNTSWQSQYLSEAQYTDIGYWTAEFTPSDGVLLGTYDFRVRFKDTDNDYSAWEYKNNSVEIQNSLPTALDITLLDTGVLRGKPSYIFANGEDYEDAESVLAAHFGYKGPTGDSWKNTSLGTPVYIDNQWRITFTPPTTASLGTCTFRVRFNDSDGGYSDWVYATGSIEIENNPPDVEILTGGLQDNLTVTFSASVSDIEGSNLSFRWDFGDGQISTEESPTHTYEEPGTYNITLNVTDSDGSETIYETTMVIEVSDEGDEDEGEGFGLMLLLIIILPIFIVVIIVVMILSKRRKEEVIPPKVPPEEEVMEFEEVPPKQPTASEALPKEAPPPSELPGAEKPEPTEEIKKEKLAPPPSSHVTKDAEDNDLEEEP